MEQLAREIDQHIAAIDQEHGKMQHYSSSGTGEVQAAYLQAKSTALLAKTIAAAIEEIKEAAKNE